MTAREGGSARRKSVKTDPYIEGMSKTIVKPRPGPRSETREKPARPPLYKVILLNDDFTPREFVVEVLKAVFRMNAARVPRDDDRAPEGRLRDRGLCARRRREQGEGGDGARQAKGLSLVFHDRAGGVGILFCHYRAAASRERSERLTLRDPVIHDGVRLARKALMDCRDKPGNDELRGVASLIDPPLSGQA